MNTSKGLPENYRQLATAPIRWKKIVVHEHPVTVIAAADIERIAEAVWKAKPKDAADPHILPADKAADLRRDHLATDNTSRYWSPERAARECGVSKRTFAEWMATGKVQFFKPSRRVLIDPTILATDLAKFRRQRMPKRGRPRLPARP